MVNNIEQIIRLLKFGSEDDFYFSQIIKRKKEHPELGSNNYIIKTYFITSEAYLRMMFPEMVCLADFHRARVGINLNVRSFEQIAFQNLQKTANQIMNKDFKSVRKSYTSVCGLYSNAKDDKRWIVDVDHKNKREINGMLKFIEGLQPEGNKFIDLLETKNGFHLITKPFNMQEFKVQFPDIEVHKDNPTALYYSS